jgi:hypothetical protein
VLAPLTTDTNRWAEVIFSSPTETRIKLMDDSWHWHDTESNSTGSNPTGVRVARTRFSVKLLRPKAAEEIESGTPLTPPRNASEEFPSRRYHDG